MHPHVTAGLILREAPLAEQVRRAAGGRRVYLVGGAVRDALLGRPTADLDFVVEDAPAVAAQVARAVRGTVVPLHEHWPTARVVAYPDGRRVDLDFAAPRARSLRADLAARDFTLNALAAGPLGPHARLLDPCGGRRDLARGLVRMVSPEAPSADPVRVVRAFRFAAQLGFRVEAATRRQCARLAERVRECAAERVGAEMMRLCAGERFGRALESMDRAGVLLHVVPALAAGVGVEQGGAHEFDVYTHSVTAVRRLEGLIGEARRLFAGGAEEVRAYLQNPETRAALVLATLLHDVGKPECRVWRETRWRFFGHETRGAQLAEKAARDLRLPRRVRRRVGLLVLSHMRLLTVMGGGEPTERARRRLARDLGPDLVGLALLCLADRRALGGEWDPREERPVVARLAALMRTAQEVRASPRQVRAPITGDDLVGLGLTPGPVFREILEAVTERWIAGAFSTKAEAVDWVRRRWGREARSRPRPQPDFHGDDLH